MSWPLSQDFNEAVQNPGTAFGDPDLKTGEVTTNAMGVPMPRSGNFADVYQVTGADGQKWAVKCFTRPTSDGLDSRYAAISEHLKTTNLAFTVGFNFLHQGIRIRGKWYPIVKMQWVDGYPINNFVKENLNRASLLENMLNLWVRLCRRLRETGMAHCDIQHGNVLLVPSSGSGNSLGLKLVDYDGIFVPALANQPTGEAGHTAYQHPERVSTGAYSADLDRFPHLVVATALRGLLIGGKSLWDRYDNGDNLLFTDRDFKQPSQSKLLRELWDTGDPFTVGLVGHLALSCTKPLHQTPWIDQLMSGGQPPILTPNQERQAASIIGVHLSGGGGSQPAADLPVVQPQQPVMPPRVHTPQAQPLHPQHPAPPVHPQHPAPPVAKAIPKNRAPNFEIEEDEGDGSFPEPRRKRPRGAGAAPTKSMLLPALVGGGIVLGTIVAIVAIFAGGKGKQEVADRPPNDPAKTTVVAVPPVNPPPVNPVPLNPPPVNPAPPEIKPAPPVVPMVETPMNAAFEQGRVSWVGPRNVNLMTGQGVLKFTPDGKRVLFAPTVGGIVRVIDSSTGDEIAKCQEHEPNSSVFPIPLVGNKVLSAARDPVMIQWDPETGKPTARAPLANGGGSWNDVRGDEQGKYALMFSGAKVSVVDIEKGNELMKLDVCTCWSGLSAAAINAEGTELLIISPDKMLRRLSLPDGKELSSKPLQLTTADAMIVDWLPSAKLVAIRPKNPTTTPASIQIVNTDTGEIVQNLMGPQLQLPGKFSRDGKVFAFVCANFVELRETTTWRKIAEGKVPALSLFSNRFDLSPDGKRMVAMTSRNQIVSMTFGAGSAEMPAAPNTQVNARPAADQLTEVVSVSAPDVNLNIIRQGTMDRTGKMLYIMSDAVLLGIDPTTKKLIGKYEPTGSLGRIWTTTNGVVIAQVRTPDRKTELHVLDGQTCRLTGPSVIPVAPANESPRHISVGGNGGLAAITKENGHVAMIDLSTGQTPWTHHPNPLAISAHLTEDSAQLAINTGTTILVHSAALKVQFIRYPAGAIGVTPPLRVEDFAPDATAVVLRATSDTMIGRALMVVTFKGWKAGPTIPLDPQVVNSPPRIFGDSRRLAFASDNKLLVFDTQTAQKVVEVPLRFLGNNPQVVPGPTGEFLLYSCSNGVSLYRTAGANAVVQAPPPPMPMMPKRTPVPDEATLAAAEKKVREAYASDFAKKSPADRKKLAERLLNDAKDTTDTSNQYYMLKEASGIATELHDPLAFKALDQLTETYEVDSFQLRLAAFEKFMTTATLTPTLRSTAELAQDVVESLADKDEYEKATKMQSIVAECYKRAGSQLLQRDAEQRLVSLKAQQQSYDTIREPLEKLKTQPNDPAANTAIGKYRCFVQGRWDDGFKLLALGNDPKLKKLADTELQTVNDPELNDLKRGDLWWEYSQSAADPDKPGSISRAKYWYAKAAISMRGLDRANAEKRMTFSVGANEYRLGVISEYFTGSLTGKKLRGVLDYTIDYVPQEDINTPNRNVAVRWSGTMVPPMAGRYTILAETRHYARVTLGQKPDERKIIEVTSKSANPKLDATLYLTEKPIAISVEFEGPLRRGASFKLKWIRPGSKVEELIPNAMLFHNKNDEKLLTDK